jgi:tetratricopeptide (TPR) repeat protein
VEICVDGGLEATMYSAQAQLADAYIANGSAPEARFIAEDLVAREPWDRANIERFRRALVLMGEADPDGIIADRLSGQSPFMSTDLTLAGEELEGPPFATPTSSAAAPAAPAPAEPAASPAGAAGHFALGEKALDLQSMFVELDTPPAGRSRSDSVEVDLSVVLEDIKQPQGEQPLRDEASRRAEMEAAEEEYRRGVALYNTGRVDEAVSAFEAASRAPRLRFATASLLARIYRDRGALPRAIEWFERAAEAPAPSPEQGHQLLYDLADALEAIGETARALAVCMELQADVGDYRDIAERIDRLAKVQARG